jgi:hypothetical protein
LRRQPDNFGKILARFFQFACLHGSVASVEGRIGSLQIFRAALGRSCRATQRCQKE